MHMKKLFIAAQCLLLSASPLLAADPAPPSDTTGKLDWSVQSTWKIDAEPLEFVQSLDNKKVFILGGGPSVADIKGVPEGRLLMTCNFSLKFLYDIKVFYCDFIVLNGKVVDAIVEDPETREFFKLFKFGVMVVPSRRYKNMVSAVEGLHVDNIIVDDIWDNYYLKKLIAPTQYKNIVGNANLICPPYFF